LSVCPHDKTKIAKTKNHQLGTGIVHQPILGQKVKGQGYSVTKCKKVIEWLE